MKTRYFAIILVGVLTAVFLILSLWHRTVSTPYRQTGDVMGTEGEITVVRGTTDKAKWEAVVQDAFAAMRDVDRLMTTFDARSELSQVNKSASFKDVPVSPATFGVIERALSYYRITGGAFDSTVFPLVELWGFGPRRNGSLPSGEELSRVRGQVGSDNIRLDPHRRTVRFLHEGVKLDLGGIAKGYAVDAAIEVLLRGGITNALVNIGGDLRCIGSGRYGHGWRIGVYDPTSPDTPCRVLQLRGGAAATSGIYWNYKGTGAERYGHIIDPRSGRPVKSDLLSVTILARSCEQADALATAVFVMGAAEGLDVIERFDGVEGILMVEAGDGATKIIGSQGIECESTVISYAGSHEPVGD